MSAIWWLFPSATAYITYDNLWHGNRNWSAGIKQNHPWMTFYSNTDFQMDSIACLFNSVLRNKPSLTGSWTCGIDLTVMIQCSFPDDSRFFLDFNKRRIQVKNQQEEHFVDAYIAKHWRYGEESITEGSLIGYGPHICLSIVPGEVQTALKCRNKVLSPFVVLFPGKVETRFIFIFDTYCSYRVRVVTKYLAEDGI